MRQIIIGAIILLIAINSHAQKNDFQFIVEIGMNYGYSLQELTIDNHTFDSNVTTRAKLGAGVRKSISNNFSFGLYIGTGQHFSYSSTTSNYGSSSEFHSFAAHSLGLGLYKSFDLSDRDNIKPFIDIRGNINLPGKLKYELDGDDFGDVSYNINTGYEIRFGFEINSLMSKSLYMAIGLEKMSFSADYYEKGTVESLHSSISALKADAITMTLGIILPGKP